MSLSQPASHSHTFSFFADLLIVQPVFLQDIALGKNYRFISPPDGNICQLGLTRYTGSAPDIYSHPTHFFFPNALHKNSATRMVASRGRFHTKKGNGAVCAEKWLFRNHGSFQPRRLMESVQLLLDGTHSQKIQVRYANKNAWMIQLMISRSGESLRPRINVMRTASLSTKHTLRVSRESIVVDRPKLEGSSPSPVERSHGHLVPTRHILLWQVRNEGFSEFILR